MSGVAEGQDRFNEAEESGEEAGRKVSRVAEDQEGVPEAGKWGNEAGGGCRGKRKGMPKA